jgi:hypothetical protein
MTRQLTSFDDGAMTLPAEELPDVAKAANEVVQEAGCSAAQLPHASPQRHGAVVGAPAGGWFATG